MDTTTFDDDAAMDPGLREAIDSLAGRALMAMLRSVLLLLVGTLLACWGFSWLGEPYLDTKGAGLFLAGVGLWFLWGARHEIPFGMRLKAEAERLRLQYDCDRAAAECEREERLASSLKMRGCHCVAIARYADGSVRRFYQPKAPDHPSGPEAPRSRGAAAGSRSHG